jgi:hypothetical protein
MPIHDFDPLFSHYPEIISEMSPVFSSHEFILFLARRYQSLYIDALFAYRQRTGNPHPTPFKVVHGILAKHRRAFPSLVTYDGEMISHDIFLQSNACAQWRRL